MLLSFSEAYTLQYETTCDKQILSSSELVVKAHYLTCIQEIINWYWGHKKQQQLIIVPTLTSVHPCIYVVTVENVHDIPRSIFDRNQAKKAL